MKSILTYEFPLSRWVSTMCITETMASSMVYTKTEQSKVLGRDEQM